MLLMTACPHLSPSTHRLFRKLSLVVLWAGSGRGWTTAASTLLLRFLSPDTATAIRSSWCGMIRRPCPPPCVPLPIPFTSPVSRRSSGCASMPPQASFTWWKMRAGFRPLDMCNCPVCRSPPNCIRCKKWGLLSSCLLYS
ncbi:hypothetical protein DFH08DRAFT_862222 [Mycena albidolilacea]|uniref:Uncharacterized protein n=1 Tax=Mycena albidolilacea TaxID=1033008 RepID=A0AAD7A6Q7_9AGAR|nr:hypothetical protein DFH08DRAFT_862222 [Mycena albidolilacea]